MRTLGWRTTMLACALWTTLGCRPPLPPQTTSVPTQASEVTPSSVDVLLLRMQERLLLMHEVARWKWTNRQAITDPQREQAFLETLATKGLVLRLDPTRTRAFFAAQIAAAKLIQEADFREWQAGQRSPFEKVLDLATQLRPRIDAISQQLLTALSDLQADSAALRDLEPRARVILIGPGITDVVRQAAIGPLLNGEALP